MGGAFLRIGSKLFPSEFITTQLEGGTNLVQFSTMMLKFLNWALRNNVLSEFVCVTELYCVVKKPVCQEDLKYNVYFLLNCLP